MKGALRFCGALRILLQWCEERASYRVFIRPVVGGESCIVYVPVHKRAHRPTTRLAYTEAANEALDVAMARGFPVEIYAARAELGAPRFWAIERKEES